MTTVDPAVSTADPGTRISSLDEIRAQFPALERMEAGAPVAYFDGPGGTQVPRAVAEAVTHYLFHRNANTHWNFASSRDTDTDLRAAREALADFLGGTAAGIAFGANMTTLTMHVSRAIGARLGAGDEIVVTELDHQANIAPWAHLERERGITLRVVPLIPETGTLDWDAFDRVVGEKTRVVAIGAASNAIGTITDVARAARAARDVGALSFVDAVHYASHELVDVEAFGCDLLACSPYKFYGPHLGVLWGRGDLLADLDVARLPPASNEVPERIETGTLNHEGIVGAAAAVDFLAGLTDHAGTRRERLALVQAELHRRGEELLERLWNGLAALDGVTLHGPPPGEPRTATLGFRVTNVPSDRVAARLSSEFGVFASDGDFYATTVVSALGLPADGLVRAGCACYTSADEIDRLIAGVRTIAG